MAKYISISCVVRLRDKEKGNGEKTIADNHKRVGVAPNRMTSGAIVKTEELLKIFGKLFTPALRITIDQFDNEKNLGYIVDVAILINSKNIERVGTIKKSVTTLLQGVYLLIYDFYHRTHPILRFDLVNYIENSIGDLLDKKATMEQREAIRTKSTELLNILEKRKNRYELRLEIPGTETRDKVKGENVDLFGYYPSGSGSGGQIDKKPGEEVLPEPGIEPGGIQIPPTPSSGRGRDRNEFSGSITKFHTDPKAPLEMVAQGRKRSYVPDEELYEKLLAAIREVEGGIEKYMLILPRTIGEPSIVKIAKHKKQEM